MVKVFQPNADRIAKLGFASVAHVPVIFDNRQRYCREYNRYLRERAELDWRPSSSFLEPRSRTLKTIAENLGNWIRWCESKSLKWEKATYDHILAYQDDQDTGTWSAAGEPLARSTSNGRADDATYFLTWAAHRGLRGEFKVNFTVQQKRIAGRMRTVTVRPARLKEPLGESQIDAFRLPQPVEVRDWLAAVRRRRGYAKYLVCRFMLETGVRLGEAEAFPLADWPSVEKIDDAAFAGDVFVPVLLSRGTKGGRHRTIRVPIELAREIRTWIDGPRNKYIFGLYKRDGKRTDNLFVSDAPGFIGIPIRRHTIGDCFAKVTPRPKVWSPRKGRHAFACFFILYALDAEARAYKSTPAGMGVNWVHNRGTEWLKMLKRQYGHVDKVTTQIYLKWLATAIDLAEMANGWHRFLAGDEESRSK
ncbi:site-specific integrase [Bradyrhizobium sp. LMG 9283]|uniref:site-specific integrase n=1 Tax=Bradyrhizobium sp. LMG 9283 TaxID=592064 RepID=UPI00388EA0EA